MSFASNTNGTATALRAATNEWGIAKNFVFPIISGRDAPGKTGSAAKPAVITLAGLYLASNNASRRMAIGIWNTRPGTSVGSEFVSGNVFIAPNTNTLKNVSIMKPVFSGVNYLIGGKFLGGTAAAPFLGYSWGVLSTGSTLYDTSQFRLDFVPSGTRTNGELGYRYLYNVLPTAPLSPVATVGGPFDFDITVTWDAPASDGGTAVTEYRIDRSPDGIVWTTIVANSGTTSRTYTDANLAPNTTFYYRVAAINAVATAHGASYSGPYSEEVSATIPDAEAGNALSLLTATVDNPEPNPVVFTDFGPGIRFTEIDVQYGAEYLYNEIQATTQDSFAELQTTDAPKSKALYGVRTYSLNNLLNSSDLGAFEVAKDYLTYYYQPELRVQSITVNLKNLTIQEKLQVLGLEIDSFISVSFTPNGIGDPKVASGLVTGIAHRISITTHEVELRLRNERTLFTTDSDSKGILNVNILGP
jgi:hypothetical protein